MQTRKSRLLDLVENKVCFENVVDGEILAPCVHDLKRNGDKDGKLSDSKFQIVEVTYYFTAHSSASNLSFGVWELSFAYDSWVPEMLCFSLQQGPKIKISMM